MGNIPGNCGCVERNENLDLETSRTIQSQSLGNYSLFNQQTLVDSRQSSQYNLHNNYFNKVMSRNQIISSNTSQMSHDTINFQNKRPRHHKNRMSEQIPGKEVKKNIKKLIQEIATPIQVEVSPRQEVMEQSQQSYKKQSDNTKQFKIVSSNINNDKPQKKKLHNQKPKSHRQRSVSELKRKIAFVRRLKEEENEKVLKEGELMKFCAGVARKSMAASKDLNGGVQFVDRWCQVTENKFRYYKNKITAYNKPDKPLLSIPLLEIVEIQKFNINKDETQFEIILAKQLTSYILERSVLDKVIDSPQKKNTQGQGSSPNREVKAGHLMRVPHSRNTQKIDKSLTLQHNRTIQDSQSSNVNRTLRTSSMYIEPDKNQWTKRESDWYDIEEKLIFKNNTSNIAEGDKKSSNKWIKAIKQQQKKLKFKFSMIESVQSQEDKDDYFYTFTKQ